MNNAIQKYFWLIMILSLGLAVVWPAPGLVLKNHLTIILMVMMTISCLKIDLKKIGSVVKDWKWFVIILSICYLLSLFVIWLGRGFISPNLFVGLVVAASVPCAISVVFMSDLMGGDPNRALVATTVAHLLAPVITPLLVWLVAREIVDVDFITMFILIAKLIIIPIIIAQILRRWQWSEELGKLALPINTTLLALLNWGMVSPVRGVIVGNMQIILPALIVTIFAVSLQIAVAMRIGSGHKANVTGAVVAMYKNTGLAAVITTTVFGPAVAAGTVVYVLVCNLLVIPLQYWAMSKRK